MAVPQQGGDWTGRGTDAPDRCGSRCSKRSWTRPATRCSASTPPVGSRSGTARPSASSVTTPPMSSASEWTALFPEPSPPQLDGRVRGGGRRRSRRPLRDRDRAQRGDGSTRVAALSRGVFEHGTHVGSVAVVRDITEQRLAQAMLAETEPRLREGEALTHVGRWQWDVATNAVQWSDEIAPDPWRRSARLRRHLRCAPRVHPRRRPCSGARRGRAVDRPPVGRRRRSTGSCGPTARFARCTRRAEPTIDSAGAVVGLRGVGQDITED